MRFPPFGAAKWTTGDHQRPLRIQLSMVTALVYLDSPLHLHKGIDVFPRGRLELIWDLAPTDLVRSLRSNGSGSILAAKAIHGAYVDAHKRFHALLMSASPIRNILTIGPESLVEFYTQPLRIDPAIDWKIDSQPYESFVPRVPKPRGRNPLYTSNQLMTPARWAALQKAIDAGGIPDGELLELYRIRSKVRWHELRVAAIEASIISESLLRAYGLEVLRQAGFSNNKIKKLKDELTFNNLLNVVLPLSLTKGEMRKMKSHIESVDTLRSIRNDLVHGNISESELDEGVIEKGVESAIRLVRFLRTRLL